MGKDINRHKDYKKQNEQIGKNKEAGITIITLAVTILIIIILASITINAVLGDNGLLSQAQDAKELAESTTLETGDKMNSLLQEYMNVMAENSGGGITEPDPGTEPEEPEKSGVEQSKDEGTVFQQDTPIKDVNGNIITVPEGFKIASDSGDTVQEGIVIEDVSASDDAYVQGSQFVWIPIGTFTKDDGSKVEITLGRYTFDTSTGVPTLQQAAYTSSNPTNYENSVVISSNYSEIAGEHRDGVASAYSNGLNATAKDLTAFVNSARTNGGYYIGRYEASYASGNSVNNHKVASKISKANANSMTFATGTLWNGISQLDASKVAINTYNGTSVESDLMNSYAWDTAIVYIQEATGLDYANAKSKNSSLMNTGTTGDEVCKINDMASNLMEWTTEYCSFHGSMGYYPCTSRGGSYYDSSYYTAYRDESSAITNSYYFGFRLCIYL